MHHRGLQHTYSLARRLDCAIVEITESREWLSVFLKSGHDLRSRSRPNVVLRIALPLPELVGGWAVQAYVGSAMLRPHRQSPWLP